MYLEDGVCIERMGCVLRGWGVYSGRMGCVF